MRIFGLVLISGAFFSLGDIVARKWSEDISSIRWLLALVLVGTLAYTTIGLLMRHAEFTKVAIWVSITLTSFSCLYGVLVLGDPVTPAKVGAVGLALGAAYLSVL